MRQIENKIHHAAREEKTRQCQQSATQPNLSRGTRTRFIQARRYRRTTSPLWTLSSAAKTMLSELIAAS
jgi:hypothetical protein